MNRILIVMCQGAAAVALVASTQAASAAPGRRVPVSLPEQSLSDALQALSSKTGVSIIADAALVANRPAPAVKKGLTVEQALTSLLANSSLRFSKVGDGYVVVLANGTAAKAPTATGLS